MIKRRKVVKIDKLIAAQKAFEDFR